MIDFGEKLDVLCSTVEVHKLFPKYLLLFFVMQFNREVKHDVYVNVILKLSIVQCIISDQKFDEIINILSYCL